MKRFANFACLFPVKTTTAKEVIVKLYKQKHTLGNLERIICDRGAAAAFISNELKECSDSEGI